jgi:hypothetical protein
MLSLNDTLFMKLCRTVGEIKHGLFQKPMFATLKIRKITIHKTSILLVVARKYMKQSSVMSCILFNINSKHSTVHFRIDDENGLVFSRFISEVGLFMRKAAETMELLKSMRQSHHSVDSWCDAHGDAWLC